MNVLDTVVDRQNKYPVFYGIFGEAIMEAINRYKNVSHPLIEIIEKQHEALWEKELSEATSILGLSTPQDFLTVFKLHPKGIASSAISFRALMAEIYVLFSLHLLGFEQLHKVETKDFADNPDYTAVFHNVPFVIEVWGREQDENAEEFARIVIAGNRKGPYDVSELERYFERIIESNLGKYENQMKGYVGSKKIAAVYYPGKMLGILPDKQNLERIGKRLLQKTACKVNHFLFRFKYESLKDNTKALIFPTLDNS